MVTAVPLEGLHRLPKGERITRALIRTADARSDRIGARVLRATRLVGHAPVPLYWWRGQPNFGDALSPEILGYVSGATPAYVGRKARGKVLGLGSILRFVRPGDVVWGSGLMESTPLDASGATFLAVRGPLTRSLVRNADVPDVYGDPAILLPRFYNPPVTRRHEVCVVPHFYDWKHVSVDPKVAVVNVRDDWRTVIDTIRSSDVVVSSSLHGIIIAETYGIPAVWAVMGDRLVGGSFKFDDYYLSSDREARPVDWSTGLKAAVNAAVAPPTFSDTPLVSAWERYWASADKVPRARYAALGRN